MAVTNKANITAVMGGSGSGKSTFIKKEIRRIKPARLLAFDVMHEYGEHGEIVTSCAALAAAVKKPSFKIIFQPTTRNRQQQFDFFCKLAFKIGNLLMVIEELNTVTDAGGAPADWQDCTSRGRHKGLQIYGASQRPTGVDKDFFSNATRVRTGRLNYAADIKTLADVLNIRQNEIAELKPLEFIERDMTTGAISRGLMKI